MNDHIATVKRTKEILQKHNFSFKKSLGQNFLVDRNILDQIVTAAQLTNDSGVIEVGPGFGALTERLAEQAQKIVAFEIDERLLPILAEVLHAYPNVTVIHADVMQTNLTEAHQKHFQAGQDVMVVANLPYYVTTPIIMKILAEQLPIRGIVCMIQKEVAERISASPGTKEYGSLSLAVNYYAQAETVFTVPSHVFIPKPKVDSAVLKLVMHKKRPVMVHDEPLFFTVIKAAFAQRRKTVLNSLALNLQASIPKATIGQLLNACDIDPVRRGETLTMKEFARLSNAIYENISI